MGSPAGARPRGTRTKPDPPCRRRAAARLLLTDSLCAPALDFAVDRLLSRPTRIDLLCRARRGTARFGTLAAAVGLAPHTRDLPPLFAAAAALGALSLRLRLRPRRRPLRRRVDKAAVAERRRVVAHWHRSVFVAIPHPHRLHHVG